MDDLVAVQGHGHAIDFIADELGGMHAKLRGEHAVIGAGAAAALDVAGHHMACLHAHHLAQLRRDALADAVIGQRGAVGFALLLLHFGLFLAHGALGHGDDAERLLALGAGFHGLGHLFDIVGYLGQQNHVRAARQARIQRQPARFVAHDFDHHAAAVAGGRGVDAVDDLGSNIHRRVETKGKIGAIDIIVDGLGQTDHVEPFLAEQVGRLVRAVAAQSHQAVELEILVGLFHGGYLVHAALVNHPHVAERLTAGSQNGAAQSKDAGELLFAHLLILALDEPAVAVADADDLRVKELVGCARHAADSRVEAGAVATAGQNADSALHRFFLLAEYTCLW